MAVVAQPPAACPEGVNFLGIGAGVSPRAPLTSPGESVGIRIEIRRGNANAVSPYISMSVRYRVALHLTGFRRQCALTKQGVSPTVRSLRRRVLSAAFQITH